MVYEVWDVASGNRLAGFGTLEDALSLVRSMVAADGRQVAHDLFIERREGTTGLVILDGPTLLARVLDTPAA